MTKGSASQAAKSERLKIFCIEGWTSDLRSRSSVRPLLELLETEGEIRFIHQRIASVEELKTYFEWWTGYTSYELGFLAFHGNAGSIEIGSESITVQDLIDLAEGDPD